MKWFDSISIFFILSFFCPSYAFARGEGEIITTILISALVVGVIFLISRELVCWYWKINQRVALLTEIRDLMTKNPNKLSNNYDNIPYNKNEKNYCPKCNTIKTENKNGQCLNCGTTLTTLT